MQNNNNPGSKPAGRKTDRTLYAVLACMLVIIVVLIILLLRSCPGGDRHIMTDYDIDPNASIGQLEGKTPEEIQAELNRIVEEGMFNISINATPVFNNGTAAGSLKIENIPANHYNMKVKITLDSTGEVIYQSGIIEPNHHIENAPLDVPLPKGTHAATATFTAIDPETNAAMGYAAARITILVEN
ncbi:MAG: hypothetical protein E7554_02870 [Ruminococcaceae bacterium]|nr:hypothetical protein [Oscillospiraceae bacterium]